MCANYEELDELTSRGYAIRQDDAVRWQIDCAKCRGGHARTGNPSGIHSKLHQINLAVLLVYALFRGANNFPVENYME